MRDAMHHGTLVAHSKWVSAEWKPEPETTVEAGSSQPTIAVAARLRKALRCSWNELMKGID